MKKISYASKSILLVLVGFLMNQKTFSQCLEVKYTLTRNGVVETKISRIFDRNKKIISEKTEVTSNYQGNFTTQTTYEYDNFGNNTSIIEQKNGVITKKINKTTGTNGVISEVNSVGNSQKTFSKITGNEFEKVEIFYESDGVTEALREVKEFDKKGNLLKKEIINKDGKKTMTDEKIYDSKNNILKYTNADLVGNIIFSTEYFYNNDGKITADKTTRNNILFAETKYEYNNLGQMSKKIRLNGKGAEDYFHTYEYNSTGKISKESFFYNNALVNYISFEYDSYGNKIKESNIDTTGKISSQKTWEFNCD